MKTKEKEHKNDIFVKKRESEGDKPPYPSLRSSLSVEQ